MIFGAQSGELRTLPKGEMIVIGFWPKNGNKWIITAFELQEIRIVHDLATKTVQIPDLAKNVFKVNEKFTIKFYAVFEARSGWDFDRFRTEKNTFKICKIRIWMVNLIYCALLERVTEKKSIGKINKNRLIL